MSINDSNETESYAGVTLQNWESAFGSNIIEFAATQVVFTREDQDQIRVAFGNRGPFTDTTGKRDSPRYTHAVTLPPKLAVELAQLILQNYAQVAPDQSG